MSIRPTPGTGRIKVAASRMNKRRIPVSLSITALLVAGACAIPVPRSDHDVARLAVDDQAARTVFKRYVAVRQTAAELLDAKPLSIVEGDPLLAIDAGSFELSQKNPATRENDEEPVLTEVYAPRLERYPLWFVAHLSEPDSNVERIAIFERNSSTEPWQMVESPQILDNTSFPELRETDGGLTTVGADSSTGLSMSPQQAADEYAIALADPDSTQADELSTDGFMRQMRQAAKTEAALDNVAFTQKWKALDVRYSARAGDGAAIAWVTLERDDIYRVKSGMQVSWPKGSPQRAFLDDGITGDGTVRYYHQVLLYVPQTGSPRALGHYGGVIGADEGKPDSADPDSAGPDS